MKRLLLTSILIIGAAGSMLAKEADIRNSNQGTKNCSKLVTDQPIPNPNSPSCPKLVADQPIPNPNSPSCPKLVG
jgi:hypothetical protein